MCMFVCIYLYEYMRWFINPYTTERTRCTKVGWGGPQPYPSNTPAMPRQYFQREKIQSAKRFEFFRVSYLRPKMLGPNYSNQL